MATLTYSKDTLWALATRYCMYYGEENWKDTRSHGTCPGGEADININAAIRKRGLSYEEKKHEEKWALSDVVTFKMDSEWWEGTG